MRLEIDATLAVGLAKSLEPARSKDSTRLALTGVKWEMPYGETPVNVFTTTDGYRLHRVTIGDVVAVDAGLSGIAQSVTLSGDVIKAVLSMAKLAGKTGRVVLSSSDTGADVAAYTGNVGTVEMLGGVRVDSLSVEFANCVDIIARSSGTELPAYFSPKYLGDVIDAAGVWAGKDGQVRVDSLHVAKPARIVSWNGAGTFTGIIMPQRAPKAGA